MLPVAHLKEITSKKILTYFQAIKFIANNKKAGRTIGLCHGGFDLLHPGHLTHFESAKKLCDILMVSITSDKFVSGRKGAGRPVFSERLRAYMVAHLDMVDYVVISNYKTGVEVINHLKPSFYIKGPDFLGKQTPGIMSERAAIAAVGGKIKYTNDPKLSTTEIIDYIQKNIRSRKFLVVIDRDGTLIQNDVFFGKQENWRKNLKINKPLVDFLAYLKTKYDMTMIVITNQAGVARRYFPENRVKEINEAIDAHLKHQGIKIASWQYCPEVDLGYAKKHPEVTWVKKYVKNKTQRKPSTAMVDTALKQLNIGKSGFAQIIVIGNHVDDSVLAKNLQAHFIDAGKHRSLKALINTTDKYLKFN